MARHNPFVLSYETERAIADLPNDRLFNHPGYKRLLEKWCAATFGRGFSRHVADCMIEVEDIDEQREYDFHLLTEGKRYPFQVVEVLDADRRRGLEYRKPGVLPAPNLAKPPEDSTKYGLDRIAHELRKKIGKHYAGVEDLGILIYLNMFAPQQRWAVLRHGLREVTKPFSSVWAITDRFICSIKPGSAWPRESGWKKISK